MKRVLWIGPRLPDKKMIVGFRRVINNGKYFEFDFLHKNVPTEEILERVDDYCCVVGSARIDVIEQIVQRGIRYYKTVLVKPADNLYRFLGFYFVTRFKMHDITKLRNGVILNISRHRFTDGEVKLLKRVRLERIIAYRKNVTDGYVVKDLMDRLGAGDVYWVTDISFYNGLNRLGVMPVRAVYNSKLGDYDRVAYVEVDGVMYDIRDCGY